MQNIINHSLCLTHGGSLSALYGILATNMLSSTQALKNKGDQVFKFTDPDGHFSQEDNFLFFESMADRGRLHYADLMDKGFNHVGFSFLLVANAKSLFNQVDMLGESDGVLCGKNSTTPLEISLSELDYKILVPQSYQSDIECYCEHLKNFGIQAPLDKVVFKPLTEIHNLIKTGLSDNVYDKQKVLCDTLSISTETSQKDFSFQNKDIQTKTSTVTLSCAKEALNLDMDSVLPVFQFNGALDVVEHMRSRPTPANLQRGARALFQECSTNSPINDLVKKQKNALIFDLIEKPEALAFCLNQLAQRHPSQDTLSHGEKRIASTQVYQIGKTLAKSDVNPKITQAIIECLSLAQKQDITANECAQIIDKHINLKEWYVAINRVQHPVLMGEKDIHLLQQHNMGQEILLWKQGMNNWVNIKEMPEFETIQAPILSSTSVFQNINKMREKSIQSSQTNVLKI